MSGLRFREVGELWPLIDRAFQEHARTIRALVPHAEVEHIGATAIPGAITKGDLDLLVRVPPERFGSTVAALEGRYEIHQPENWKPDYASFKDEAGDVPIGVQSVVTASDSDIAFVSLRRLLRDRPDLVERVNDLKRSFERGDPDAYVTAKGELYEHLLQKDG
jgi:GrpB-like predicted nucleotidyltransferase (UPF0157 family)